MSKIRINLYFGTVYIYIYIYGLFNDCFDFDKRFNDTLNKVSYLKLGLFITRIVSRNLSTEWCYNYLRILYC